MVLKWMIPKLFLGEQSGENLHRHQEIRNFPDSVRLPYREKYGSDLSNKTTTPRVSVGWNERIWYSEGENEEKSRCKKVDFSGDVDLT